MMKVIGNYTDLARAEAAKKTLAKSKQYKRLTIKTIKPKSGGVYYTLSGVPLDEVHEEHQHYKYIKGKTKAVLLLRKKSILREVKKWENKDPSKFYFFKEELALIEKELKKHEKTAPKKAPAKKKPAPKKATAKKKPAPKKAPAKKRTVSQKSINVLKAINKTADNLQRQAGTTDKVVKVQKLPRQQALKRAGKLYKNE